MAAVDKSAPTAPVRGKRPRSWTGCADFPTSIAELDAFLHSLPPHIISSGGSGDSHSGSTGASRPGAVRPRGGDNGGGPACTATAAASSGGGSVPPCTHTKRHTRRPRQLPYPTPQHAAAAATLRASIRALQPNLRRVRDPETKQRHRFDRAPIPLLVVTARAALQRTEAALQRQQKLRYKAVDKALRGATCVADAVRIANRVAADVGGMVDFAAAEVRAWWVWCS